MNLLGKRNRALRGATLAGALASAGLLYGVVIANPFPGQGAASSADGSNTTSLIASTQGAAAATSTGADAAVTGSTAAAPASEQSAAANTPQPTATPTTSTEVSQLPASRTSRGS